MKKRYKETQRNEEEFKRYKDTKRCKTTTETQNDHKEMQYKRKEMLPQRMLLNPLYETDG